MLAVSLIERVVEWIEPAFLVAGYLIIAVAILLERSILIGLIVPGDVILALGGIYASQGKMSLTIVVVIGTLCAIVGESAGYWLGRRYGMRIIRRLPVIGGLVGEKLANAEEYFRRHGGWTVAIGRYATAAGAFIPFTAGLGRMRYAKFLLFDVPAVVVWAAAISIFGYVFGQNLPFVDRVLSRFGWVILGFFVVFFGLRFLWKRVRGRSGAAAGGPES